MASIARSDKLGSAVVITGVMGERGGTIVSDTNPVAGDWSCIYPLTNTVISSATLDAGFTGSLAGVTLSAGIPFYGRVTAITLTSGTCVLYNRTSQMEN